MARAFDAATMAEALDRLALAAIEQGVKLDVAIYGGSALMLASNFRYASEDVDAHILSEDRPPWLHGAVARIGRDLSIAEDWFNEHVLFPLSDRASETLDHVLFGTFPRGHPETGLRILVPTAPYMLALKLKAMRVDDPVKGRQETADIVNLMRVVGCGTAEQAIDIMGRYFPRSAESAEKQAFLLRHLPTIEDAPDAPEYPVRGL